MMSDEKPTIECELSVAHQLQVFEPKCSLKSGHLMAFATKLFNSAICQKGKAEEKQGRVKTRKSTQRSPGTIEKRDGLRNSVVEISDSARGSKRTTALPRHDRETPRVSNSHSSTDMPEGAESRSKRRNIKARSTQSTLYHCTDRPAGAESSFFFFLNARQRSPGTKKADRVQQHVSCIATRLGQPKPSGRFG